MDYNDVCDKLEELADMITSDKLKKVTDFLLARERFVGMIQQLINKSNLQCEVKDTYIGEVSAAEFVDEEKIYLAVDCVTRKNKHEQWMGDTLFIPIEYISEKMDSDSLMPGIKLLSIEMEKKEITPRVLN